MPNSRPAEETAERFLPEFQVLRQRDISVIEEALKRVGAFGEVHLVVEHGRLRFVRTLKSEAVEGVHLGTRE